MDAMTWTVYQLMTDTAAQELARNLLDLEEYLRARAEEQAIQ